MHRDDPRRAEEAQTRPVTSKGCGRSLIVSNGLRGARELMITHHRRPRDASRDVRVVPLPVVCPQQLRCSRLDPGQMRMFPSVTEKRRVEQG